MSDEKLSKIFGWRTHEEEREGEREGAREGGRALNFGFPKERVCERKGKKRAARARTSVLKRT